MTVQPFETAAFGAAFDALLHWRRDVRHFRTDQVDEALVLGLLEQAHLAPSVGFSQPWRFVRVRSEGARAAVRASFERCNAAALAGYEGEQAARYAGLKLSGLDDAPVQISVFCDEGTATGAGLGRATMPEMAAYSVVTAIHTLWLAARVKGLGLGWVSILDPAEVTAALDAPSGWRLVAHLCLGWPVEAQETPELQRRGWERRRPLSDLIFDR